MKYRGRFSTPEEFGDIVIRSLPDGDILRLKDVADVRLGDEAYNYSTSVNGRPAAIAMIYQTAGSNAAEIIREIDTTMAEIGQGPAQRHGVRHADGYERFPLRFHM